MTGTCAAGAGGRDKTEGLSRGQEPSAPGISEATQTTSSQLGASALPDHEP